MNIVEATDADLSDVLSVERAAFGQEDEARLTAALLQDPTAAPCLSLLAYVDGRPAGHILFTKATLRETASDVPAALLAPMAVVPAHQRRGIGRALIQAGIERLTRSGIQLVFVLGHPDYYTGSGFEPAVPRGLLPPYPIDPEEAWMVRRLGNADVRGRVACAACLDRPEYWRE
ncbi:MAG: N-acetyltransferase [Rhodothermales bacterium]